MASQRTTREWVGDQIDNLALQHPARIALGAFGSVILLFTGLLSLPAATTSGTRAPFIDALFTATSAVCVTGLVTVDTGTYWSPTGLTIIAIGIKVGGLGIMTLASLVGLAVSRRIGLTQRILAAGEARATGLGDLRSLLRTIVIVSTSAEAIIALVLFPRFLTLDYGLGKSAGFSVFYAISAFNNAGFSPDPLGLIPYAGDPWMLMPIGLGVFVGALGFPVYLNIMREWRRPRRWTLHTKLTLVTIAGLALVSASFLAVFEWSNPNTLGDASTAETVGNIFFQSINQRSGGFASFDIGQARETTWLLEIVLMFIGGGSGSTAGGIRVTTLAVLVLAIWAEARGRRDIEAFGKRIGTEVLRLAVSVTMMSLAVVILGTTVFLWQTGIKLDQALYEVVSAFATCGLSTGITADLDADAKATLIAMMYIGRVGSLTVVAALALNRRRRVVRYPKERPLIG
ncbi:TrkH family potassium uptake protein [Demequina sp. TTPB684]|uniref:TrkH family potassium uptake protein n=1 Tax=unclassified Demequina TaxID=2620311 RepID=UPI001CF433A0|nr:MULTISPECIES: potassium transporter TrkG [unclassified Demequina]MCB2411348.1 TrkH family potassium uptake protein [Demequina sp. TTPB684]UPU88289.1 TrkH family potassium uptake protein [Demequina sp. TMPB413]